MKHLKILLLLIGLACADNARSDIIFSETDFHQFRIVNLEKYPKISLVAVIYFQNNDAKIKKAFVIQSNKAHLGYFGLPINFYVVDKNYINKSKGIYNIKWNQDKNVQKMDFVLKPKFILDPKEKNCDDTIAFSKLNNMFVLEHIKKKKY